MVRAKDHFNYELDFTKDLTLVLTAAGINGLGNFLYSRMEIPEDSEIRDPERLLPWDRKFAGRYSETADHMSDIGAALATAPFIIGGIAWYSGNSNGQEFATFTLMFTEAIVIGSGINLAVRSLGIWPRPYIYAKNESLNSNEDAQKQAQKAKPEAYGSFFSGHATAAFTVATFTDYWFCSTYPNSPYQSLVRAVAYSLAGLEGALRIAAGKHYPTDVIVGALVGTGISWAILKLHQKKNRFYTFWVFPNSAGVTLQF